MEKLQMRRAWRWGSRSSWPEGNMWRRRTWVEADGRLAPEYGSILSSFEAEVLWRNSLPPEDRERWESSAGHCDVSAVTLWF